SKRRSTLSGVIIPPTDFTTISRKWHDVSFPRTTGWKRHGDAPLRRIRTKRLAAGIWPMQPGGSANQVAAKWVSKSWSGRRESNPRMQRIQIPENAFERKRVFNPRPDGAEGQQSLLRLRLRAARARQLQLHRQHGARAFRGHLHNARPARA